eukprot:753191-Hanusia_phi.AAC.1
MQAELEKRRNDLNITGNFNRPDDSLTGNAFEQGDDRELQIRALVSERLFSCSCFASSSSSSSYASQVAQLSQKERQLEEIQSDDLARCLLDTQVGTSWACQGADTGGGQESVRQMRSALVNKESLSPPSPPLLTLQQDNEVQRLRSQLKELSSGSRRGGG